MNRLGFFKHNLLGVAVSVFFLLPLIAQAESLPRTTRAEVRPSHSAPFVRFADERLTVKVQDITLRELLQEIARESGLTLVLLSALPDRMTVEFHRLPLEQALRRLLRHRNFALEYGQTAKGSKSAGPRLWVFANGEGEYPVQTPLIEETKTRSSQPGVAPDSGIVQAALQSPDPDEREDAVDALGESGRPDAIASLSLALADENADVRDAAIDALADIGGDEAAEALAVALQDEDATLREDAVEALSEIGGETAIRLLEQALQDNDKFVQDAAAELLARMRNESH